MQSCKPVSELMKPFGAADGASKRGEQKEKGHMLAMQLAAVKANTLISL